MLGTSIWLGTRLVRFVPRFLGQPISMHITAVLCAGYVFFEYTVSVMYSVVLVETSGHYSQEPEPNLNSTNLHGTEKQQASVIPRLY